MKRTPFKQKPRKPMKRGKLRLVGKSPVSETKREIQAILRKIVIKRDKGCVLRHRRHCGGTPDTEGVVLQADHLISRGNNATFADPRLVVCLCRPCHGGFKKWNEKEYDDLVKTVIPKETVALWDRCLKEKYRVSKMDWTMELLVLQKYYEQIPLS